MGSNVIPKRTSPKEEIAHTVEPHNRPYTGPTPSNFKERPREVALAEMVTRARDRLRVLTPASAVEEMGVLPRGLLELYLLVEEADQARPLVLRSFPKPGSQARERYSPFLETESVQPQSRRGRRRSA